MTNTVPFYLDVVPRVVRFRDRKQNGDCQGLEGEGNEELLFKRNRISVWGDEKFPEWIVKIINFILLYFAIIKTF